MSATAASTMLSTTASAQPSKGGTLKLVLGGGESTNSLDPAKSLSQVPFNTLRTFGETILDVNLDGSFDYRLAESIEPSEDAKARVIRRFLIP